MTATMGAAPADMADPAASAKRLHRTDRDEIPIDPIMGGLTPGGAGAPHAVQRINEDEWIAEGRRAVAHRIGARRWGQW